jgi:hypothetical protein
MRRIAILHGNQSTLIPGLPNFFLLSICPARSHDLRSSFHRLHTVALISEVTSVVVSTAAAYLSFSHPTQGINIKSLAPITLDMQSTSFLR